MRRPGRRSFPPFPRAPARGTSDEMAAERRRRRARGPEGVARPARAALRSIVRALVVAAAVLATAGCGTSETMPEDEAEGTVRSFLAACARDEGVAALEALTEPTQKEFLTATETAGGCKKVLRLEGALRPPIVTGEAFRAATVSEVHVEGGFGTALVTIEGRSTRVELEEVGAKWKLSNHPL